MYRYSWLVTAALVGTQVVLVPPTVMAVKPAAAVEPILQQRGSANARGGTVEIRSQPDRSVGLEIIIARQDDPKTAIDYYDRAILKYTKLNDTQGALADFNRAIFLQARSTNVLDPQDATAYYQRGSLKDEKLNDSQGALADYNRAISINPQYAIAYGNRGILKAKKLNDKAGAIQDFRQAAKLSRAQGQTQYSQKVVEILHLLGATE